MLARTDPAAHDQPPDHASTQAGRDNRQVSGPSARWGDLRLRLLSAAVLAPLALGCIWIGGAAFAGLIALISIGLSFEWLVLCDKRASARTAALFAALPLAVVLTGLGHGGPALGLLAIAAASGAALNRGRPVAFGIPYLGLAAVALVWLRRQQPGGAANVIVLLLVIWASDIGAYMAGRAIGGWRLAPAISPGKTWSGAVGGVIATAAVGFAASAILGARPASARPVVLAVLIGLIAQAGDLFESHLKRRFGVKDSGSMIPGHGGLLDRLDAVLTAAPVTALLALILGPGVVLWE